MKTLILGGAACVWEDAERAREIASFDRVAVLNHMIEHYEGEVDLFATLHPEFLHKWTAARQEKGYPPPRMIAAHKNNTTVGRGMAYPVDFVTDYRWPGMSQSGTSSLFAVKAEIELGASHIVLCGCPLAEEGGFFDRPGQWGKTKDYRKGWEEALPHIKTKVRSMSGWTADLIGRPTPEWLNGAE
jgi:hypothetical protein